MQPVEPIHTTHLFLPLHQELLALLRALPPEAWEKPTVAAGWSVRDMVAHLLDTDLRRLSSQRDRLPSLKPSRPITSYVELVGFIDELNAEWVTAARRLSPRVLADIYAMMGPQVAAFFETLDQDALSVGVGWAGEERSPMWFDLAREYTEKWMHQQQIRDAVGAPALTDRPWFHPVLDTFVRGLPHTFRVVEAPDGTAVTLTITGPAGDSWALVRSDGRWELFKKAADKPAAQVTLDQDIAWRLFTKGLTPKAAIQKASLAGEQPLAEKVLELVAIMG
jgi:uncharacterized protein (TIGR03083 family)